MGCALCAFPFWRSVNSDTAVPASPTSEGGDGRESSNAHWPGRIEAFAHHAQMTTVPVLSGASARLAGPCIPPWQAGDPGGAGGMEGRVARRGAMDARTTAL